MRAPSQAFGDLFRDVTGGVLRGCMLPYLEGAAEQAREQSVLVASKHPLPASTEGGEEAEAMRQQHVRAILQGCIDVFALRSSVGRRALNSTLSDLGGGTGEDTLGAMLASGDPLKRKLAWDTIIATSNERKKSSRASLIYYRCNVQNLVTFQASTAERVAKATFASHDTGGMLEWALTPGQLPHIGDLAISRSIMYGAGAPDTVLAEPFDENVQEAGFGGGTVMGVRMSLANGVAAKAPCLTTDAKVTFLLTSSSPSPHLLLTSSSPPPHLLLLSSLYSSQGERQRRRARPPGRIWNVRRVGRTRAQRWQLPSMQAGT